MRGSNDNFEQNTWQSDFHNLVIEGRSLLIVLNMHTVASQLSKAFVIAMYHINTHIT